MVFNLKYSEGQIMRGLVVVLLMLVAIQVGAAESPDKKIAAKKYDDYGREIIKGPLGPGFYNRVHIVSDTVGVVASNATRIINSAIEAPVCIQSSGINLTVENTDLICGTCLQYTNSVRIGVQFSSVRCAGR